MLTVRPAELLEPRLVEARNEIRQYIRQDEDVLTYIAFPEVALEFFRNAPNCCFRLSLIKNAPTAWLGHSLSSSSIIPGFYDIHKTYNFSFQQKSLAKNEMNKFAGTEENITDNQTNMAKSD